MKPIPIAIIGLGTHAKLAHIPSLDLTDAFRLVAVATSREQTAREAASRYRVTAYAGYGELLARADVEAVIVAGPSELHDGIVRAALERGKHVLVETPAVSEVSAARAVLEFAARRRLVVQAGFVLRSAPPLECLRQFIQRQTGQRLLCFEYFPFLSHIYNLALHLAGPVQEVLAATGSAAGRTAVLQHANGDVSHVVGRALANCSVDIESVRVSGAKFYASVEGRRRVRLVEDMAPLPVEDWSSTSCGGLSYEPQPFAGRFLEASGCVPQLRAFAQAIREGVPPPSTLEDAIATKELMQRIERVVHTERQAATA